MHESDSEKAVAAHLSEFMREWDVYRDEDGKPVTVTWEQVRAIWRAVNVVEQVRQAEGHESLWHIRPRDDRDRHGRQVNYQTSAELSKSRLLGRMLVQGRPPTRTKPPVEHSGPVWAALPDGDPFADEGWLP